KHDSERPTSHRDLQSQIDPHLHPSQVLQPPSNSPQHPATAASFHPKRRALSHRTKHPDPSSSLQSRRRGPSALCPNTPRDILGEHRPRTLTSLFSTHRISQALQSVSNRPRVNSPFRASLFHDVPGGQRRPLRKAAPIALQYLLSLLAGPGRHPPKKTSV